ncbi:hypothetical protein QBC47DRAFT_225692 [Echria macrotheca]|uniref:GAR domain-containing protein n=1 Tax=Echria macrotheca TaxID=438768 RepID=A0AAJ0BAL1_9PEZI|nr:hypothetical protein QBC47DRAFT_225692 [Echria macrotheca]
MADPFQHELRLPRGRQTRPTADSPTFPRGTDDLLSNLTPRAAVEAFRNPMGTLKQCMDMATPTEQAFALRAAIASKNIHEWLEELMAWPWPSGGGSAGFEAPTPARRRLFHSNDEQQTRGDEFPEEKYYGGVLATDVAKFEGRIKEISRGMEDLDVEEIKSQVLHNHIMPLSRPGSPMLDTNRPMSSLAAFATMDDLTALITATLMQALPNLSRLTRLMNTWTVRLLVLKKIPVFLRSITDAESALQSGWNAINSSSKPVNDDASPESPSFSTLSRKEFDIMKSILERKVAKSGQNLDVMLDMLEGSEETLPEHWIDRVDALERRYGEWTVACEQKIREADWARIMKRRTPQPVNQPQAEGVPDDIKTSSISLPPAPPAQEDDAVSPTGTETNSMESEPSVGNFSRRPSEPTETFTSLDISFRTREASPTPLIKVEPPEELETRESKENGGVGEKEATSFDGTSIGGNCELPDVDEDVDEWPSMVPNPAQTEDQLDHRSESEFDFGGPGETDVPEPELPTLPRPRRDSELSNPSTVIRGLQSGGFMDFSSDQLEHGTPELPRLRDSDLHLIPSDDLSLEGSPQAFRSSTRSLSVSFHDMPTVAEVPDDDSRPRTPVKSSFLEDDMSRDFESPSKAGATNSDEQLQQQISEILESVPAKIRLKAEPAINLNPPDFNMPTRKPPKPDPYPRSQSSLSTISTSSRAGTPSFTLAPAYGRNNRSRHQHGNQEIKLYHLSRSNGEAPIKLFIRCVGEHGERVMVRVGGGWADLGEYLKEYASHHGRRSGQSKVEIKDLPSVKTRATSTPPRPQSAQEARSPITPLNVRKSRKSTAADEMPPKTPLATMAKAEPSSGDSGQSRSSSRLSWAEEDSSLGMAGPRAKQIEMSEESKAWVESVKEKVRIASGERKVSESSSGAQALMDGKFGEMGKVGATKRLFRRQA